LTAAGAVNWQLGSDRRDQPGAAGDAERSPKKKLAKRRRRLEEPGSAGWAARAE
jgi:hypothetical protein